VPLIRFLDRAISCGQIVRTHSRAGRPSVIVAIVPSESVRTHTGNHAASEPQRVYYQHCRDRESQRSRFSVWPTCGFSRAGSPSASLASAASRCSVVDHRVRSFVVVHGGADKHLSSWSAGSEPLVPIRRDGGGFTRVGLMVRHGPRCLAPVTR